MYVLDRNYFMHDQPTHLIRHVPRGQQNVDNYLLSTLQTLDNYLHSCLHELLYIKGKQYVNKWQTKTEQTVEVFSPFMQYIFEQLIIYSTSISIFVTMRSSLFSRLLQQNFMGSVSRLFLSLQQWGQPSQAFVFFDASAYD